MTTQRRRQAHLGHKPTVTGGGAGVTIICECRWDTGRHMSAWSAWSAFDRHEKDLEKK